MPEKTSVWHRLYHGETAYDFIGKRRRWYLISTFVIVAGFAGLFARGGLNLGIDFKGGSVWEVKAPGVSVPQARDVLRPIGLGDAKIQILGGDKLSVQGETGGSPAKREQVTNALAKLGHTSATNVDVNEVGPSWGNEITKKAERALVFFFIAIAAYITLRFEYKMAIAALAAVVHDILVTIGVYALSGFQVTPATVIAFLTILGYSLYDTVVVFDKVEENTRGLASAGRMTYADTVNLSMNQVLMRSLNTSLVAILPILSVLVVGAYILGATTLEDFGLALLIGLLTGAYSSIFVASPILAMLKEREPRYASIRQRLATRGGTGGPLTPAAAAAAFGGGGGGGAAAGGDGDDAPLRPAAASASPRPRQGGGSGGANRNRRPPPRPRKKRRR
jgi:preprotein translocase subunit SecF